MTKELHIILITCIVIGMVIGIINPEGNLLYRISMNTIIIVVGMISSLAIIGIHINNDGDTNGNNSDKNKAEDDKEYITREWPKE